MEQSELQKERKIDGKGKNEKIAAVGQERKIEWNRILLAFLIGNLLFFFGIFLGYLIGQIAKGSAISIEEDIKSEFISLEVQNQLLESYPCSEVALKGLSDRLDEVGKIVDTLETRQGVDQPDVLKIKSLYTLFEMKHYFMTMKRQKDCKEQYDIVWFFYSNAQKTQEQRLIRDESQKIGFILSYLRNVYPSLRVYSLDASLQLPATQVLKESLNITKYPSVVVNGKLIPEPAAKEDVEKYFLTHKTSA